MQEEINSEQIKIQFDEMDEKQQWEWLVSTDLKDRFTLFMDNDDSCIVFRTDEGNNFQLTFKADIGNRPGVEFLLSAIGVSAYHV